MSPILFAYHGIGRADPHIPTKFTRSRLVISAYYATLANLELRPMLGLKRFQHASTTIAGTELMHRISVAASLLLCSSKE